MTTQPTSPAMLQLSQAASRGALTHSLLLWGEGDLHATATYAAAAYQCTSPGQKPCGGCPGCKKAFSGIHPDVITVEDTAHKQIAVDVVRAMRSDAFIRPNEGVRKVYVFPDSALLSEQGQNVLLKLVEEGPGYSAFIFCAKSPSSLLQTMRSRCVQIGVSGAVATASDPVALEAANALCRALLGRRGDVIALCTKLEKKKFTRPTLEAFFMQSRQLCAQALLSPRDNPLSQALRPAQIMGIIDLLQRYYEDCAFNIGVGHTLGALAIELEELK